MLSFPNPSCCPQRAGLCLSKNVLLPVGLNFLRFTFPWFYHRSFYIMFALTSSAFHFVIFSVLHFKFRRPFFFSPLSISLDSFSFFPFRWTFFPCLHISSFFTDSALHFVGIRFFISYSIDTVFHRLALRWLLTPSLPFPLVIFPFFL